MPLFVWINGLRGPEPQIWHVDQTTGEGKRKDLNILSEHKIDSVEAFEKLIEKYPAPNASTST